MTELSKIEGPGGRSRVVITGVGVVGALGCGRRAFWEALCDGRSGIAPVEDSSSGKRVLGLAAALRDFNPKDHLASAHLRRMDKLSRMITAATRMALDDARVPVEQVPPQQLGIVVGSAFGNVVESMAHMQRLFNRGPSAVSPMIFPNLVLNAPASYASMELGVTGANLTVSQLEVSGEQAILVGADVIRAGRADVVVAGGGDELGGIVSEVYHKARALSAQRGGPEWCSPYDAERNGIVIGEGAAMLVLESAGRAAERGAEALAEVEVDAMFSVPAPLYDWPAASAEAVAPLRALLASVAEGGIDLVCGGGNSSRTLDRMEIDVFSELFGPHPEGVWLTSVKGAIGEFGAAGATTVAAAALALRQQMVPPLCNLRRPEAGAGLRFAERRAMPAKIERALVSGVARGGAATALVLRRPEHGGRSASAREASP